MVDRNPSAYARPAQADGHWLSRQNVLALVLLAATALAFYLCYRLVSPFLGSLAWALALAVVARPLHSWVAARVRSPDLAAGLAVAAVAALLLVPVVLMTQAVVAEAATYVERAQTGGEAERLRQTAEQDPRLGPALAWVEEHVDLPGEIARLAREVAARAAALVTGSVWTITEVLIALFTLFFLFRDRDRALRAVRSLVPLSDPETDQVFGRVADTVHATVYGTLLVALVQGALGGLMFWLLGLRAPVLWGVVMALLAVIPYLGAFVVWMPAAVLLALEGDWGKALILTAWGSLVVGLIDNLLYPILVGNRLRMHTVPVFFAIVGGLHVFGAAGVVLGPLVLAVTLALLDIWRRRTAGGRMAEDGVDAGREATPDGAREAPAPAEG